MGLGLLGIFFFLKFKGALIPLIELWFVLSIFSLFAGGYFLAHYKLKNINKQSNYNNKDRLVEIERLKRNGEKLKVTLENAEVKSRSYQQKIVNEGLPSTYKWNRNSVAWLVMLLAIIGIVLFYRLKSTEENKAAANKRFCGLAG